MPAGALTHNFCNVVNGWFWMEWTLHGPRSLRTACFSSGFFRVKRAKDTFPAVLKCVTVNTCSSCSFCESEGAATFGAQRQAPGGPAPAPGGEAAGRGCLPQGQLGAGWSGPGALRSVLGRALPRSRAAPPPAARGDVEGSVLAWRPSWCRFSGHPAPTPR